MADTKGMLFNDGEGLRFDDLNAALRGAEQQAWEVPGIAKAFNLTRWADPDRVNIGGSLTFANTAFQRFAFTAGGIPVTNVGLEVRLGGGFIGQWVGTAAPIAVSPKMRWSWIADSEVSITLSAAALKRYDLIRVQMTEVLGDPETRHLKDAVTGVLSTAPSVNKRRAIRPVFSVQNGVEHASAPIIPQVAAGYAVVAAVKVEAGVITEVLDTTVPLGSLVATSEPPSKVAFYDPVRWEPQSGGGIKALGSGGYDARFPSPFAGDGAARIVGIEIRGKLSGSAVATIQQHEEWGAGGLIPSWTITSSVNTSGVLANSRIILLPETGDGVTNGLGPFWCQGQRFKAEFTVGPKRSGHYELVITSGAIDDEIRGVTWWIARP